MLVKQSERDQEWLENKLADIWYRYFSDIEQENDVLIQYGRKAKRRLGSIGLDRKNPSRTIIYINPIYQDPVVPEYVVDGTIVHEMTHYAHGFNSPHQQKHKHPHSGGVIRKEFAERGLESLYIKQQRWLKEHWLEMVDKYFGPYTTRTTKHTSKKSFNQPWWIKLV